MIRGTYNYLLTTQWRVVTSELELWKSLGKKSKSKKIQKLNTRLFSGGDAVAGRRADEKHVQVQPPDGGKISSVRLGDTVFHADLSAARGDRVVHLYVVRQPLSRRETERGLRLWLKVNILNHVHVACVVRRIQITGNDGVDNCAWTAFVYRRVVEVVRRRAGNGRSEVYRGRESKPINSFYARHRKR